MLIKKLGIVLFLLLTVIGFSCSNISAGDFPNDLHMDVSIGGGTGDCLLVYSSTLTEKYLSYGQAYDHVTGEKERRWTWLAMNNDIKEILICGHYSSKPSIRNFHSRITSDKWSNNVDNIDYLWVESRYYDYTISKLYLKNGTIIDEWEHYVTS